jgi:hypothetical protein
VTFAIPLEYQDPSQSLPSTNVCLSAVTLIQKVVDDCAKAMSTASLISSWNFFFAADHEEFEEKGRLRLSEHTMRLCATAYGWFPHRAGGGAVL